MVIIILRCYPGVWYCGYAKKDMRNLDDPQLEGNEGLEERVEGNQPKVRVNFFQHFNLILIFMYAFFSRMNERILLHPLPMQLIKLHHLPMTRMLESLKENLKLQRNLLLKDKNNLLLHQLLPRIHKLLPSQLKRRLV